MGQANVIVFLVCILPEVTWENGLNENIYLADNPRKYQKEVQKQNREEREASKICIDKQDN